MIKLYGAPLSNYYNMVKKAGANFMPQSGNSFGKCGYKDHIQGYW